MLTSTEVTMEMIKNLEVEDDASGDDRKNRQNARHLNEDNWVFENGRTARR